MDDDQGSGSDKSDGVCMITLTYRKTVIIVGHWEERWTEKMFGRGFETAFGEAGHW